VISTVCPLGQKTDGERTPFGSCMDAVRTLDPTRTRTDPYRPVVGEGLYKPTGVDSPSPSVQGEVWVILRGGVDSLDVNDRGRPWPYPSRSSIARLADEYDRDLCLKAAWEAREIVQSQDRAPNITGLFEKKLHDLADVRDAVRGALSDVAAPGEPCR
jgi:hypothetical protein